MDAPACTLIVSQVWDYGLNNCRSIKQLHPCAFLALAWVNPIKSRAIAAHLRGVLPI